MTTPLAKARMRRKKMMATTRTPSINRSGHTAVLGPATPLEHTDMAQRAGDHGSPLRPHVDIASPIMRGQRTPGRQRTPCPHSREMSHRLITSVHEEIDSILQQAQQQADARLHKKREERRQHLRVRSRATLEGTAAQAPDNRFGVPPQQRTRVAAAALDRLLPAAPSRRPAPARASTMPRTPRTTATRVQSTVRDENSGPVRTMTARERQEQVMARLATPKRRTHELEEEQQAQTPQRTPLKPWQSARPGPASRIPKPRPGTLSMKRVATTVQRGGNTAIPLPRDSSLRKVFTTPGRTGIKRRAIVDRQRPGISSALERARARRKAASSSSSQHSGIR